MDKKAYQNIKISLLTENVGQVEGLPRNPRWIKDERYKALKKSIEDAPEFLDARMLLVYPHEGKYVVIAGNMRLKACKELGFKELPCYVFREDTNCMSSCECLTRKAVREKLLKPNRENITRISRGKS